MNQPKVKISISPFGWGEIAYRDFETINSGSILIKPNMNHLATWPEYYKEYLTYIPVNWDLSDLIEKIENTLENYNDFIKIPINAQSLYKRHTIDKESFNIFMERLNKLVK